MLMVREKNEGRKGGREGGREGGRKESEGVMEEEGMRGREGRRE